MSEKIEEILQKKKPQAKREAVTFWETSTKSVTRKLWSLNLKKEKFVLKQLPIQKSTYTCYYN